MTKEEYQKLFIDCICQHFSKNGFGLPYNVFCKQFKDARYTLDDIYEMFCFGIDYGSGKIKPKEYL